MSSWLHAPAHSHFTVPPFYSLIVILCRHVTRRPCHRATIPPCHLPHRPTVPFATPSHNGTCHTVSPCYSPHCPIVPPVTPSHRGICHTVSPCHLPHRVTVPSATPCHRAICHTVPPSHLPPPCRNRVAVTSGAPPWQREAVVPTLHF